MTKEQMCEEYSKCYLNILSSNAEQRIQELDKEAASMGLKFKMTNETQWLLPHFLGAPNFELIEA